ncbi:SDR family NAD(P)-dependent oxidoreductase, partial [Noviherbaspirillum denitrificans]|uniref:SDR family NAD(P)-dependent oxidoreductase n=1 Tax=Noviherbaspirillum denitrificans TaxID=1968433 RepID=UPI000B52D985
EAAEAAAARLGSEAVGYALDVASEESVSACAIRLNNDLGGVDVLVNNAGIDPHYARLEKTSSASWHEIVRTNLDGVFYCCKYFTAAMLEEKKGSVINISSIAGKVGLRRQVPYCATKGGVEQITRALALDWADAGVRVNGIGYGFIKTDLTSAITGHEHLGPQLLARTPLARFGSVEEVTGAAIFLASDAASYMTGHTIMVDGGWTAS